MGHGDDIMATGMAKGASGRGRRIAFGDGRRIIWGPYSEQIFRGNPNVAPPGSERASDLEWVAYHKGNRLYNRKGDGRWIWNLNFHPSPGEFFFSPDELALADKSGRGFIVIEPNVPWEKSVAPNKDWGAARYQAVADQLTESGLRVVQFAHGSRIRLERVERVVTSNFRNAAALLSLASLYVGPEGGLHHAAAAVGTRGVVLYGGFIPPSVTGYDIHVNLTGGAEACGSLSACRHCRAAMDVITVEEVVSFSRAQLEQGT